MLTPSITSGTFTTRIRRLFGTVMVLAFVLPMAPPQDLLAAEESFPTEQIDFFEKKIRPVLLKHCYECHSAKSATKNKLKGGLLLDSRAGILKGGDSGPAAEPKQIDGSNLLEALRYESFEMPPKGKLPDEVIADFQKWIELGLPDPRKDEPAVTSSTIDIEAGRKFWCYQPLANVSIPTAPNANSPIDAFVLHKLLAAGLSQNNRADRTTLVRRLYFDLIGLPPTPAEIDAFLADQNPDAYERQVDRLLASPRFGERWGRHWLDVARYAESITLRGFILNEAWRYRDFVIRSFNADQSYDQFVRQQIAGDMLPFDSLEQQHDNLIGTGFLAMGNNNLEDQDKQKLRMDVVDEQLETIGRSILAQTIGCARCHDHKFDPIPTKDYYALAGILRSTKSLNHANLSRWIERPLPLDKVTQKVADDNAKKVADLTSQIKSLKSQLNPSKKSNAKIVSASQLPGIVIDDRDAVYEGNWTLSTHVQSYVNVGYQHDETTANGLMTARFTPKIEKAGRYEIRFAYTTSTNRATNVPITITAKNGDKTTKVNERKVPPIGGHFVSLGEYDLEPNKGHGVLVRNKDTDGVVIVDAVQFLSTTDKQSKPNASSPDLVQQTRKAKEDAKLKQDLKTLEEELKQINKVSTPRQMYMSVEEESKIEDAKVHIRGDVHNFGDDAPRGFLQVALYQDHDVLPTDKSGRLQLADWLASPDNPLPARVMTNRIWHWLLGSGLVRTTDNFGARGETPSHPELLDYLAAELIRNDWSPKYLIRQVVLSETYQASSDVDRKSIAYEKDPENRLLWRTNRRRLDAESLLDAMQLASGDLDFAMGGKTMRKISADYDYKHGELKRRAVYWPVLRNSVPPIFDAFDFANPSLVTGRRNNSSTASQALLMMNNPLVIEKAKLAAKRLLTNQELDDTQRIKIVFHTVLGRGPSQAEQDTLTAFINDSDQQEATIVWASIIQSLFASLDFRFLE